MNGAKDKLAQSLPVADGCGGAPSGRELVSILDGLRDTFYRTDEQGVLVYLSRSITRLLGCEPAELLGTRLFDRCPEPGGPETFLTAFHAAGGVLEAYESPLRNKAGEVVWTSCNAHYYHGPDGEILGIEGTIRDISQRIRQQQELGRLKSTLDKTLDCVFMFDPDSLRFFYVNEGAMKQVGYSAEELLQMSPRDIKYDFVEADFRAMLRPLIEGRKDSLTFDTVHRHKDGHEVPVEVFLQYIAPEREEPRFVAVVRDLSERLEVQEKLRHLAHHDSLTNLPNRLLFMDRLEHALARRQNRERVAVLFLDLDRFKVINDTLGHAVGDRVLRMLGERVSACIRKGDTLARISGDEFAIVLEDVSASDAIVPVVRYILDELAKPFLVDGNELFVTASIGIGISPNDGEDPNTLLKHADIAMYRAKDLGRNAYQFYSPDMGAKAFERLNLETSLRYALDREEFRIVYQPQVDTASGRIVGVEALLRWQHPEMGLVGPHDFIPLLEDTGLIVPVGEWVLRAACEQTRRWQQKYDTELRVSVNFSARQFNDEGLVEMVYESLDRVRLPAHTLEMEITETVIMQDRKRIGGAFEALEGMGVRFAVDDFGTGYSSLGYLKRFPIDTLKIDRSFVRDVITDSDDAAIVMAVIAMARSLKLDVVAEGVETDEQLAFLRSKDCALVQGYLFHKPLTAEELDAVLAVMDTRGCSRAKNDG